MSGPGPAESAGELEDLVANLFGFYSTWSLSFAASQVLPSPEIVLIDSGTMADELNIAFLDGAQDVASSVARAAQFFQSRSKPWRIEAPLSRQDAVDPAAAAIGLRKKRTRPGFVLVPEELRGGPPSPDLSIEVVDTAAKAAAFLRTLVDGNSGSHVLDLPAVARYVHPEMIWYLGSVAGEPVATAILYAHRKVAGIYAVATVERARRRGYGRAITEKAVRDGFALGCSRSFLQSSTIGRPVYEAMGYHWSFDRAVWTLGD